MIFDFLRRLGMDGYVELVSASDAQRLGGAVFIWSAFWFGSWATNVYEWQRSNEVASKLLSDPMIVSSFTSMSIQDASEFYPLLYVYSFDRLPILNFRPHETVQQPLHPHLRFRTGCHSRSKGNLFWEWAEWLWEWVEWLWSSLIQEPQRTSIDVCEHWDSDQFARGNLSTTIRCFRPSNFMRRGIYTIDDLRSLEMNCWSPHLPLGYQIRDATLLCEAHQQNKVYVEQVQTNTCVLRYRLSLTSKSFATIFLLGPMCLLATIYTILYLRKSCGFQGSYGIFLLSIIAYCLGAWFLTVWRSGAELVTPPLPQTAYSSWSSIGLHHFFSPWEVFFLTILLSVRFLHRVAISAVEPQPQTIAKCIVRSKRK